MTRIAQQTMRPSAFEEMARQMGTWVDQVLGKGYHKFRPGDVWTPAINLCEDETHYCIVVDLAGTDTGSIDLRVEKGELILSGERPLPRIDQAAGQVRLHLMEIDHGRFCRRVRLPRDADEDGIEAIYRNGYLRVRIPKER